MGIQFIGIDGPMRGKATDLENGLFTVGRGSDCDLQIANDDNVSRTHATVMVRDGIVDIEDNGSRNGVFINDKRVLRGTVADGDTLKIGGSLFRIIKSQDISTGSGGPPPPVQPVRYAGFWVRLGARLIDSLAVGLPLALFYYLVAIIAPSVHERPDWWIVVGSIFGAIVYCAYYTYMDGTTGQTIGRKAVGIKVLSTDRGGVTYNQALMRYLLHWAITGVGPAIVLVVAGVVVYLLSKNETVFQLTDPVTMGSKIGFVVAAVATFIAYYYILLAANSRKQGWHDIAAGTMVVREG
ncbi:MAG: RDD family protein [Armatimonadota bacterium]|nr:RDD family protein [Armatimonadota bacterium]